MGVLGYLMGVLGYLMGVLGYPMAWRRRQAMAKWRWGRRKWRGAPILGPPGPRHFLRPKRHLAMVCRRRQAMGTPSNWERHNIKWERHNIRFPKTPGGVGWGGDSCVFSYYRNSKEIPPRPTPPHPTLAFSQI